MDSINGCYIGCYNCILQDGKETVGLKPTAHREEDRHMSGRLAGKVAVITGAGSGIGAAMAGMFCREGARVVAADISGQQTEVAATIGGQCITFQVDVTDTAQGKAMLQAAVSAFGRLDILFNNASIRSEERGVGKE